MLRVLTCFAALYAVAALCSMLTPWARSSHDTYETAVRR